MPGLALIARMKIKSDYIIVKLLKVINFKKHLSI